MKVELQDVWLTFGWGSFRRFDVFEGHPFKSPSNCSPSMSQWVNDIYHVASEEAGSYETLRFWILWCGPCHWFQRYVWRCANRWKRTLGLWHSNMILLDLGGVFKGVLKDREWQWLLHCTLTTWFFTEIPGWFPGRNWSGHQGSTVDCVGFRATIHIHIYADMQLFISPDFLNQKCW